MKTNRQKRSNNRSFAEIFGTHAVYSALLNNKRKHIKLFISQNQRESLSKDMAKLVPEINELHNKEMYKMFGNEATHQGIVLRTSKLKQPKLDDYIKTSKDKITDVVVILDQITDPSNIGSILRSCALFNCKTVVVSNDKAPEETSSMAKAASGALEVINYISVVNLSRAIINFKKNNYWVYGFDSNEVSKNNNKMNLPKKCVLVFGSEGKGLRSLTKKECDDLITIPTETNLQYNIESLNVSNACSIALYEHYKNNL